ncbi:hypothetical protein [Luteolibacter sp. AS25]|uniref:hypothetical protein n=1 Tax=Luteolibacter sp. AS25 TaxID=3135776 RepID=UPI00398B2894
MSLNQIDASGESLALHDLVYKIRNSLSENSHEFYTNQLRLRISRWNASLGENPPGPLFKGQVSEYNIHMASVSIAENLHMIMSHRHAQSPGSSTISKVETMFEDILGMLRLGCATGRKSLVASGLDILAGEFLELLVDCPFTVDQNSDEEAAMASIRAANLVHRACAVAAAIPHIQLRQMAKRTASSLAGIAARRTQLTMTGLPQNEDYRTNYGGIEEGQRMALLAYADSAKWIDRPITPYTELILRNGDELRIHFKNARQFGIQGGHWIWGRCKVEKRESHDARNYAVAEFEGPTTNSGECWENWLQVEARGQYDYTPGSIHLFTSESSHPLDLYSRTGNLKLKEEVA